MKFVESCTVSGKGAYEEYLQKNLPIFLCPSDF